MSLWLPQLNPDYDHTAEPPHTLEDYWRLAPEWIRRIPTLRYQNTDEAALARQNPLYLVGLGATPHTPLVSASGPTVPTILQPHSPYSPPSPHPIADFDAQTPFNDLRTTITTHLRNLMTDRISVLPFTTSIRAWFTTTLHPGYASMLPILERAELWQRMHSEIINELDELRRRRVNTQPFIDRMRTTLREHPLWRNLKDTLDAAEELQAIQEQVTRRIEEVRGERGDVQGLVEGWKREWTVKRYTYVHLLRFE
ncbi:hypothetical protein M011DRAFT_466258 [Sporormia fimetaria CBS 119925]|uniref:Uncharacterized protein n=1 Tax=Sporormia fimetaria CBS 119925 TaxID=1340428 RepID=A0A6A6VEV0_9PLEO|nr:hypothetical protein M011DRAFT_466258 [Sporormia fimetaria CBS 119925]